jgi:hypothetical protein
MATAYVVDYSELPNLRQVLAPSCAILPTNQIRARMAELYGEGSADAYEQYLEGIFDDIGRTFSSVSRDVGRFAAKAAPAIATVGGGALQGALSGAQFGLPGIIAGAALGGAGAGLSKYGSGTARDIGGAMTGVTGLAGQFSPLGQIGGAVGPAISGLAGGKGGAAGAAVNALSGILGAVGGSRGSGAASTVAGAASGLANLVGGAGGASGALSSLFGGGSATGQLLSLLQRPETAQALAALNLGSMGRSIINVGAAQTPVPSAAIPTVMMHLASEAAAEAAAWSGEAESALEYMTDQAGEWVGDPALDRDRASRVWELLNEAQAERLLGAIDSYLGEARDEAASEYADVLGERQAGDEQYYDALESAELAEWQFESSSEAYADGANWQPEGAYEL